MSPRLLRRAVSSSLSYHPHRPQPTKTPAQTHSTESNTAPIDVANLLSTPGWSVSALLPSPDSPAATPSPITPQHLRHLLRLSALPPPASPAAESRLLAALAAHLHFVRAIQAVDTTGVRPLRSLRDETAAGQAAAALGLAALSGALEREEVRGKHHRRIRRRDAEVMDGSEEGGGGDLLAAASRRVGRFLVVEGGKGD